ncbi:hypothetical protein RSAG8_06675, partial [Rhizoctonia solani AG-8 WAC10335]
MFQGVLIAWQSVVRISRLHYTLTCDRGSKTAPDDQQVSCQRYRPVGHSFIKV